MPLFGNREREPRRIKPPEVTHWEVVSSPNGILAAGADLYAPGFGNVGKKKGYIANLAPDHKNWDLEDKLYAETLLQMSQQSSYKDRLHCNYTLEDIWEGATKPKIGISNSEDEIFWNE